MVCLICTSACGRSVIRTIGWSESLSCVVHLGYYMNRHGQRPPRYSLRSESVAIFDRINGLSRWPWCFLFWNHAREVIVTSCRHLANGFQIPMSFFYLAINSISMQLISTSCQRSNNSQTCFTILSLLFINHDEYQTWEVVDWLRLLTLARSHINININRQSHLNTALYGFLRCFVTRLSNVYMKKGIWKCWGLWSLRVINPISDACANKNKCALL